jgi:apolipoprotein N-acyltransferase
MASFARLLDTTLVAGVTITLSATAYRNEIVAFGPSGQIVSTFEKVHRVPFGEYVPFRGFFSHLADLSAVPRDAVPGHGSGLMRTPAAPIGVMVSYEVFFASRGRSSVRAGAQLLVVPTNTASYASTQIPAQEVAADRVQTVAQGRDLVQAAPTGYSTVVDNRGAVRLRSVLDHRQVLISHVALRRGATVYERFGDIPVLVLAALALAGGLAVAWRARRRGTDPWDETWPATAGRPYEPRPERRSVTIVDHGGDTGDRAHSEKTSSSGDKPPSRSPTGQP